VAQFDLQGIGMTSQRTRDRLVARLRERGITSDAVLDQLSQLPRHIFVEEALAHSAYEETALPIGHGQTISQPFVVALMTQLLTETPRKRVLEVGTGCGYQTAVLAGLCDKVWTVERIQALVPKAQARLKALRIRNVLYKVGDGYAGWSVHAPFDGIIVTAAPPRLPDALLEQLAPGGRLVIPVGGGKVQELRVVDRTEQGFSERVEEYVRFVPLQKGITEA
jgi:protein-L-isoaspartate(D-aspartate) O-methyltransferase